MTDTIPSVSERIEQPSGRREPRTVTMADLMANPRFTEALAAARRRDHEAVMSVDDEYQPPAKPVHRYTDDELKDAVRNCRYCGGLGFVKLDVEIHDPRFGKAQPCPNCEPYQTEIRKRRDLARMQGLIDRYSMLRGQLSDKTFKNFTTYCPNVERTAKIVHQWALDIHNQNPDGLPWLYLYGTTGTGKTHLAAAVANGLGKGRIAVIFTTFPELLGMVTANHFDQTEPAIQALQTIPVLILDDIREGNLKSDWACSVLFRILDHRYVTQSPTMVVSNHPITSTDLGEVSIAQFEPRVASRLSDRTLTRHVFLDAKDYRQQQP